MSDPSMDDEELAVLLEKAAAWRDDDPDPRSRAELERLVSTAEGDGDGDVPGSVPPDQRTIEQARTELADRFAGTLQFGTAGLRGALGAGPNRMNRAVVIRAAAGLAAWLRDRIRFTSHAVVGFDARHDSDVFAHDTAAVLAAAGVTVAVLPRPLPTPVLAFCVRHLGSDAGVMVTASHNPPQDNGYKVYLGGRADDGAGQGSQLVPPADAEIAAAIADVGPTLDVPMDPDGWSTLDDGIVDDYLDAAIAVVRPGGPRDLDLVLTPLHGVGGAIVVEALRRAGFPPPYVVPEQADPDPDFPTVGFPNPEEPGAVDLAVAAARARGADLVIANDPDADRCAVAVPDRGGGWRMLRGDEVGGLLGEHLLTRAPPPAGAVVASSVVSSELLARIAAAHGVRHVTTLTGFKWISRVPGLLYGYEEALGYCVAPTTVRDKDGITAALVVAELAAGLEAGGRTLLDALDDLALAHGVHATDQLSIRVSDLWVIATAMTQLRSDPPATLGASPVVRVHDLGEGGSVDGGPPLPPTDGLLYRTAEGGRVVVRPSGTEPKLKCYLEVVVPVTDGDLDGARALAGARLLAIREDLTALLRV